jgi:hypothetical protein
VRRAPSGPRDLPEVRRSVSLLGLRGPTPEGNYSACCPFCEERVGRADEDFKLTFRTQGEARSRGSGRPLRLSPERAVWNCYRCGARGLADFSWAVEDADHRQPEPQEREDERRLDLGPPEGFVLLEDCARSVAMRRFFDYFRGRRTLGAALAVGCGAVPDGRGYFRSRVVVPILGPDGRWVGFSARSVSDRQRPKYLYPAGMDRRSLLLGEAYLPADGSPAYVVEGAFDWLALWPRAVATLGTGVTDGQIARLVALGRPLVPCLDGDAWLKCRVLAHRLRTWGAPVPAWCRLPPGSDPGKLGQGVERYAEPLA